MCLHCLATIRTFRGIPHHSRLNPRTFPGLSPDNPQTVVVLSGGSVNRTLFPRLTRIVRRNGVIHFGNVSCSCPCSSGRQAFNDDPTCNWSGSCRESSGSLGSQAEAMQKPRWSHGAMRTPRGCHGEGLGKCRIGAGDRPERGALRTYVRRDANSSVKNVYFVTFVTNDNP